MGALSCVFVGLLFGRSSTFVLRSFFARSGSSPRHVVALVVSCTYQSHTNPPSPPHHTASRTPAAAVCSSTPKISRKRTAPHSCSESGSSRTRYGRNSTRDPRSRGLGCWRVRWGGEAREMRRKWGGRQKEGEQAATNEQERTAVDTQQSTQRPICPDK